MGQLQVLVGPLKPQSLRECFPEGVELTPGDTKLMWDSGKEDEVEAARATFDKLTKKGYIAFRAEGKDGHQGEKIKSFDPDAERIILVPKIAGGYA